MGTKASSLLFYSMSCVVAADIFCHLWRGFNIALGSISTYLFWIVVWCSCATSVYLATCRKVVIGVVLMLFSTFYLTFSHYIVGTYIFQLDFSGVQGAKIVFVIYGVLAASVCFTATSVAIMAGRLSETNIGTRRI